MNIKRKGNIPIMGYREETTPYLYFPMLEKCGIVHHGFSTRLGGVSSGYFATMNLGFHRGEPWEVVTENYKRICRAMGMDWQKAVISHQTHTTNVRVVTAEDAGCGIIRERPYQDVDGFVTNVPGIVLVTFYADCVPLYFVDPVHRAIGLSHSGWRGTTQQMGPHTLEVMREQYGTQPEDVLACIGPSICGDCYEVGDEVAEVFAAMFTPEETNQVLKVGERAGKYLLNLWKANELLLLEAGVKPQHLSVTDICTKCNPKLLYSHRVMGNDRGNLAAFLSLKEL
ncbi:MAG: peptidoglycan editing factor PgeF [Lachnospiraceae bacterium]